MQVQKTIKFKVGELRKGKQELIDSSPINSAVRFSFDESQSVNFGRAKKSITNGGCFSET